jgi:hypothetical protein
MLATHAIRVRDIFVTFRAGWLAAEDRRDGCAGKYD